MKVQLKYKSMFYIVCTQNDIHYHYPVKTNKLQYPVLSQKFPKKTFFQFQSSSEARCLANQVELYYSRPSDSRLELMTKFSKAPTLFSHDDLIKEVNNIQIVDAETTQEAEVKN